MKVTRRLKCGVNKAEERDGKQIVLLILHCPSRSKSWHTAQLAAEYSGQKGRNGRGFLFSFFLTMDFTVFGKFHVDTIWLCLEISILIGFGTLFGTLFNYNVFLVSLGVI